MKKLTYIILAICVMLAAGCPSDSEMTDSISEAEAAVESHNTYTVTFDPNGGDGRAFSQSFRGGRMQPLMRCSFKRTGWTFSGGWAAEPDGEKVYRNNEQVILTKDLTLYAVWTAHKYTIKFDANGGSGDMEDLSMTYDVTKHLSPNEFTRAGYGFTGWNTASDGSGTSYANGAGISNLTATDDDAVTLYAQWAAGWVDYTVKKYFQTVDGAAYAQDTANYPNLTNSGITDTETAETAVPITGFTAQPITQQTIAGDGSTVVNIYYNRNWITYTFSVNGGKWSDSTTADKDVSGYYGASVEVPVPEKTGYHYTWDSTVPTEFDDNDGAEFTAQWTANSYTIVFDANGGTGDMSSQTMTYDVSVDLRANAFTKDGCVFVGWALSADGEVVYANEQKVKDLTTDNEAEVILYAIWKEKSSISVGDIMYSDMTFSSEYVAGKTPLGIVFEVGTKVKIVHLSQGSDLAWCLSSADGYGTNPATSTSDGSGNWQIICDAVSDEDVAGNYPAFEYVNGLGSGWYLPSKNELNAVYTNKTAINTALTILSTAGVSVTSLGTGYYWSSSSYDNNDAWSQYFYSGNQGSGYRDNHYSGRAVRAF